MGGATLFWGGGGGGLSPNFSFGGGGGTRSSPNLYLGGGVRVCTYKPLLNEVNTFTHHTYESMDNGEGKGRSFMMPSHLGSHL